MRELDPTKAIADHDGIDGVVQETASEKTPLLPRRIEDLSSDKFVNALPRADLAGTQVPALGTRYRLAAKLAKGGFGGVYLGYDTELAIPVAIKILLQPEPEFVERLKIEARALAQIQAGDHPGKNHIVRVYGVEECRVQRPDGTPYFLHYIIMDFINGQTAYEFFRHHSGPDKPGLDERTALDICIAATKGLTAAHAMKVIHRDIKPGNILLPRLPGSDALDVHNAKLVDFGLASGEQLGHGASPTVYGMGTPGYVAPEQAREARKAGMPADVFGMGATLYMLLSGSKAFPSEDLPTTLAAGNIRLDVPALSYDTASVLHKCLKANPKARYRDADELLRALENCRAVLDMPPTVIQPPRPSATGRSMAVRAAVLAGLLLLLVAGAALAWYRTQPPKPVEKATPDVGDAPPVVPKPGSKPVVETPAPPPSVPVDQPGKPDTPPKTAATQPPTPVEPPKPRSKPVVEVLKPPPGTVVEKGRTLAIEVNAKGDGGEIDRVVIELDGRRLAELRDSPYKFQWNTAREDAREFILSVRAYDKTDGVSDDARVAIRVADPCALAVAEAEKADNDALPDCVRCLDMWKRALRLAPDASAQAERIQGRIAHWQHEVLKKTAHETLAAALKEAESALQTRRFEFVEWELRRAEQEVTDGRPTTELWPEWPAKATELRRKAGQGLIADLTANIPAGDGPYPFTDEQEGRLRWARRLALKAGAPAAELAWLEKRLPVLYALPMPEDANVGVEVPQLERTLKQVWATFSLTEKQPQVTLFADPQKPILALARLGFQPDRLTPTVEALGVSLVPAGSGNVPDDLKTAMALVADAKAAPLRAATRGGRTAVAAEAWSAQLLDYGAGDASAAVRQAQADVAVCLRVQDWLARVPRDVPDDNWRFIVKTIAEVKDVALRVRVEPDCVWLRGRLTPRPDSSLALKLLQDSGIQSSRLVSVFPESAQLVFTAAADDFAFAFLLDRVLAEVPLTGGGDPQVRPEEARKQVLKITRAALGASEQLAGAVVRAEGEKYVALFTAELSDMAVDAERLYSSLDDAFVNLGALPVVGALLGGRKTGGGHMQKLDALTYQDVTLTGARLGDVEIELRYCVIDRQFILALGPPDKPAAVLKEAVDRARGARTDSVAGKFKPARVQLPWQAGFVLLAWPTPKGEPISLFTRALDGRGEFGLRVSGRSIPSIRRWLLENGIILNLPDLLPVAPPGDTTGTTATRPQPPRVAPPPPVPEPEKPPSSTPSVTAPQPSSVAAPPPLSVYQQWPFDAAEAKRRQEETARALKAPVEKAVDLGNGVKLDLVLVPAGKFQMGSPVTEADRYDNETPHQVTLAAPFYIGKYEVTQAQYLQLMGRNPSSHPGQAGAMPVEQVTWADAVEFCKLLSQKLGTPVSLPTEAQWEYACRAGTATRYYTGDSKADLARAGRFTDDKGGGDGALVGQKAANSFGIFDMHGNVWEWCSDWYAEYAPEAAADPQGPRQGKKRVIRGGSWWSNSWMCRSAARDNYPPIGHDDAIGFRVVLKAATQ